MDELITWLRQALDDDEQVALAARAKFGFEDGEGTGRWKANLGFGPAVEDEGTSGIVVYDEGAPTDGQALHIARWDPARVLAETKAKRAVIDEHPIDTELSAYAQACGTGKTFGCVLCHDWDGVTKGEGYCKTLLLLAQPYADRQGFRDEWRLDAG